MRRLLYLPFYFRPLLIVTILINAFSAIRDVNRELKYSIIYNLVLRTCPAPSTMETHSAFFYGTGFTRASVTLQLKS